MKEREEEEEEQEDTEKAAMNLVSIETCILIEESELGEKCKGPLSLVVPILPENGGSHCSLLWLLALSFSAMHMDTLPCTDHTLA